MDREEKRVEKSYREDEEKGVWICRKCGSDVLYVLEAHPIWLEGTMGGPGRVLHYPNPYCPTCEEAPHVANYPIEVPFSSGLWRPCMRIEFR